MACACITSLMGALGGSKMGVHSLGIDWFTATTADGRGQQRLAERFTSLIKEYGKTNTLPVKDWTWRGYRGIQCESIASGTREDGDILRVSGGQASYWFHTVPWDYVKCTRIDVQVTYDFGYLYDQCEKDLCDAAEDFIRKTTRPGGKPKFTLVDGRGEGDTLYCGKRGGNYFGRVYGKGLQSPGKYPRNSHRWEVEFGDTSDLVAKAIAAHENTDRAVLGHVYSWFDHRGVPCPFGTDDKLPVPWVPKEPTTHDRKVAWLKAQVAPTVKELGSYNRKKDVIVALFGSRKAALDFLEGWE